MKNRLFAPIIAEKVLIRKAGYKMKLKNACSITQTAGSVAQLMGFSMPDAAAPENRLVVEKGRALLGSTPVERVLLYNPDAIGLWLYQKYTEKFIPVLRHTQLMIPVESVMPSVTPVCFASLYTGLMPADHGIQAYVKPVLQVSTLFDAAISAGKRPIIISTEGDSITKIFLERDMDYIVCQTAAQCNEEAMRVIAEDCHDLIVIYNGNYDATMHRWGPESAEALSELDNNAAAFDMLCNAAAEAWHDKVYMTAFLPDHGCHEIDGQLGSHGLDMPEDMHIVHFYGIHKPD